MKKIYILLSTLLAGFFAGCEKNDPITELGISNGEYTAELRVTYDNTRPAIGDTVIVTASTWQRDDRYDNITFYETIYETFGLDITLEHGSNFRTVAETYTTLSVTDTILAKRAWQTISHDELMQYWVTNTNNYVIPGEYVITMQEGKYPSNGSLIEALPDNEWQVLKSIVAYNINGTDFEAIFPDAPDETVSGATVTAEGRAYVRNNLSRQELAGSVTQISKLGTYNVVIEVEATTPTGAITATTRTFTNNL
ncbi:hypothetical protein SAMN05421747_1118 [Parapedobacter composti]|uniref:Uncharacterized protein n=1 Tax=Parapedobacter composti TaxID=623281 RepID=A0A1I1J5R3_9SPHI|nr:hypothetical protein [Parapedobacter composti]SFC43332.1 hypothetical protein SAMN05421747_1118 [Parapedobacter composti]